MRFHFKIDGGAPLSEEEIVDKSAKAIVEKGFDFAKEALVWVLVVPNRLAVKALGRSIYLSVYRVLRLLGLVRVFNENKPFVAFIARFGTDEIDTKELIKAIRKHFSGNLVDDLIDMIEEGSDIVIKWIVKLKSFEYTNVISWLKYAAEAINGKVYFLLGGEESKETEKRLVESFLAAIDRYKEILSEAQRKSFRQAAKVITYVAVDLTPSQATKFPELVERFLDLALSSGIVDAVETVVGAVGVLEKISEALEISAPRSISLPIRLPFIDIIFPLLIILCIPGITCVLPGKAKV